MYAVLIWDPDEETWEIVALTDDLEVARSTARMRRGLTRNVKIMVWGELPFE